MIDDSTGVYIQFITQANSGPRSQSELLELIKTLTGHYLQESKP